MNRIHIAAIGCVIVAFAGAAPSIAVPQARSMTPTPTERLLLVGSDEGMPLFPADPLPGWPGMDPNPEEGRPRRNQPQLVNYPGSVEHYTPEQAYQPNINPFNHRTLVKNFIASDLPGVPENLKEKFAEPVIYNPLGEGRTIEGRVLTGRTNPPVSVVRLKPARPGGQAVGQKLRFHLDPLPTSMYVVRVIGAIESKNVIESPLNLIVQCRINDGAARQGGPAEGGISDYILRGVTIDNFYPVAQFYFHVEDDRDFDVEISMHPDSQVDLLVHNVDVHDVLAECAKRAGKTGSITAPPHKLLACWGADAEARLKALREGKWAEAYDAEMRGRILQEMRGRTGATSDDDLLSAWRHERDDAIWESLPPMNFNMTGDEYSIPANLHSIGLDPATEQDLRAKGVRSLDYRHAQMGWFPWHIAYREQGYGDPDQFYTLADLRAHKPYPGLPFDVPVWGKRIEAKDGAVYYFSPLAQACGGAFSWANHTLENSDRAYLGEGGMAHGRDLAMLLCRFAHDLPAAHPNIFFSRLASRSLIGTSRWKRFYLFFDVWDICKAYDMLFPIIKDNQELADAVGRHIPWVKTPEDVITLLDTHLLQYSARQLMYWQDYYDHGNAGYLARIAEYQMDPEITKPWVDFIFSKTWEYPFPTAGIQDYLGLSVQRDGTTNVGSSNNTFPGAVDVAQALETYVKNGGDPKYDLTDPKLYPRVVAGPYFRLEGFVAGMHHLGIGDVGGFYRPYAWWAAQKFADCANVGWRWTKDPRFAYCVLNYGQRSIETDAEWNELVAAAKTCRNPFMSNRSRILSDWGGILEGGTQSDDFRFRHAARVRLGRGVGYNHRDSLDLSIWSLGLQMAGDAGATQEAPRYGGVPLPAIPISHNLATIDFENGKQVFYSWAPDAADMGTVQYECARGHFANEYSRQVALIELDQGVPAKRSPSNPNLGPQTHYDPDITFPRAYVFDVFRVAGGTHHMYNAHAFPDDDFTTNAQFDELTDEEAALLTNRMQYVMDGQQWAGAIPAEGLQVTWRMDRGGKKFTFPGRWEYTAPPCEQSQMSVAFDAKSPRKFLRLHMPSESNQRMVTGEAIVGSPSKGRTDGEYYRNVHVVRSFAPAGAASSLFAAVWEPYAGTPTIKSVTMEGDPNDALGYAAIHVETVDGIKDLCFADANATGLAILADGSIVAARFAYLSQDDKGLRQVCLVGGKSLSTPAITIETAVSDWEAKVLNVDYLEKTVTLDKALPAKLLDGQFFEVGAPAFVPHGGTTAGKPAAEDHDAHWTTFEAVKVEPKDDKTILRWRKGADVYTGKVKKVDITADAHQGSGADSAAITVEIAAPLILGENSQLTLTDEKMTRSWKCDVETRDDYMGDKATNGIIRVYGNPINEGDLKVGDRIRLFEFGVGDIWRAPSKVSLKRMPDGIYHVNANVGFRITGPFDGLRAGKRNVQWSSDGTTWQPLPVANNSFAVNEQQLSEGLLYLRWADGP